MIRLSVEQLHELQRAIQRTGEVNATVLPKNAFRTDHLFIAWARSISQEEFYLAVWQNEKSWDKPTAPKTLTEVFAAEEHRQQLEDFEKTLTTLPEMDSVMEGNGA